MNDAGLRRFQGRWETRRLGDYLTFLRNGTNPRSELGDDGEVRYLHYGDIHKSSHVYLNPEMAQMPTLAMERARRLDRLADGDLIFADASEDISGVGKSLEIKGIGGQIVISGLHTVAVRLAKSVLADGFKGYLQFCPPFGNHLRRLAAGTKVYATNRAHVASAEIPLPPLPEQRAIATVLSDVDELIGSLEALVAKKRAIKQAAMQELLTGRTRLPGFAGEWERMRLGDHLRFLRHGTNSRSDLTLHGPVRYLHYGDIHTCTDVYLNPNVRSMPTLATERSKHLDRLDDGDLVFVDARQRTSEAWENRWKSKNSEVRTLYLGFTPSRLGSTSQSLLTASRRTFSSVQHFVCTFNALRRGPKSTRPTALMSLAQSSPSLPCPNNAPLPPSSPTWTPRSPRWSDASTRRARSSRV